MVGAKPKNKNLHTCDRTRNLNSKFIEKMDTTDAPQILEHCSSGLAFTPFDVKWIPTSARFVLFGQSPGAKGIFNIY